LTDFEAIITDNASTDDESIGRRDAARDARIRDHLNDRNLGAGANLRRSFVLASARACFKWVVHDDSLAPAPATRYAIEYGPLLRGRLRCRGSRDSSITGSDQCA
jgi:glycosyltransferase involved in cell wall biosynthesis